MSRAPLVIANWKMNKTSQEAILFIDGLRKELTSFSRRVWIAPSFVSIEACVKLVENSSICIGAQNMHGGIEGAFTGEVSCRMLKEVGVHFVILGHSERRLYAKETNREINEKLKMAFSHHLTPVFCLGESLEERERAQEKLVWKKQLEEGLQNLTEIQASQMIIAYEPVWAIGTGRVATPEIAQTAALWIREFLEERFGRECSQKVAILYGGSVKAESMQSFMQQTDIDGVLVGGASLDLRSFIQIIEA